MVLCFRHLLQGLRRWDANVGSGPLAAAFATTAIAMPSAAIPKTRTSVTIGCPGKGRGKEFTAPITRQAESSHRHMATAIQRTPADCARPPPASSNRAAAIPRASSCARAIISSAIIADGGLCNSGRVCRRGDGARLEIGCNQPLGSMPLGDQCPEPGFSQQGGCPPWANFGDNGNVRGQSPMPLIAAVSATGSQQPGPAASGS